MPIIIGILVIVFWGILSTFFLAIFSLALPILIFIFGGLFLVGITLFILQTKNSISDGIRKKQVFYGVSNCEFEIPEEVTADNIDNFLTDSSKNILNGYTKENKDYFKTISNKILKDYILEYRQNSLNEISYQNDLIYNLEKYITSNDNSLNYKLNAAIMLDFLEFENITSRSFLEISSKAQFDNTLDKYRSLVASLTSDEMTIFQNIKSIFSEKFNEVYNFESDCDFSLLNKISLERVKEINSLYPEDALTSQEKILVQEYSKSIESFFNLYRETYVENFRIKIRDYFNEKNELDKKYIQSLEEKTGLSIYEFIKTIDWTDDSFIFKNPLENKFNILKLSIYKFIKTINQIDNPFIFKNPLKNRLKTFKLGKLKFVVLIGLICIPISYGVWSYLVMPKKNEYGVDVIKSKYLSQIDGKYYSKGFFSKKYEGLVVDDNSYSYVTSSGDRYNLSKDDKTFVIKSQNYFGLMNLNGVLVLPTEYKKIEKDKNGNYLLIKSNKYGVANEDGKIIIPVDYTQIQLMKDGNYKGILPNEYKILNSAGKVMASIKKSNKKKY